ncbi:DUF4355 domain-containing protein [Streptomyces sp. HK10]|uniref:capsid assembly scaffolding protein Gp46 family protein n=1 Tax=Streptomyces sp. HK10 TaxID=3373255 RepID=UPI0037486C86
MAEEPNMPPAGGAPNAQPGQQQGQGQGQTFTQADLDRIVAERLARERSKYADYNDLKAKAAEYDKVAEAQKTEAQKLAEQLQAAQAEAQQYRGEVLRQKVAAELGVPAPLVARLKGSNEDELKADAEELLKALPSQPAARAASRPVADLTPGALPPGGSGPTDMNEWMRAKRSAD